MKRYELTSESVMYSGISLHRIRNIATGILGGFIQSEKNLDQ